MNASKPLCAWLVLWIAACGPAQDDEHMDDSAAVVAGVYATELVSFEAGAGAGFGQKDLPGVVLGPPVGGGERKGSLDVVSLGVGGEMTLGFGDVDVIDGPGADFVVFENAFAYTGGVFSEPGEVSVSADGQTWHVFACDTDGAGCAGMTPTLMFDAERGGLDVVQTGGDGYDLSDLGLERVRYVRVTDKATQGAAPSAGFDLDAVMVLHGIK